MKRSIALVLTWLMLCGLFAGCGQKSAYETIEAAVAKTQELDDISAKMVMDMTISSEEMSLAMPISMDMKAKNVKSDNPTILTNLTLTMLGQTLDAQIYQENGWSYSVIGESKHKTQSEPQTDQYNYSEEMMQVIPEELMQDVKMEKGVDGAAKAVITIPGEKFTEVYSDLVDELSGNLVEGADLTVENAVVTISVKDGYIGAYDMSFSLTASDGEEVTTLDVESSITYENPGKSVEITPPEGYQDFPES